MSQLGKVLMVVKKSLIAAVALLLMVSLPGLSLAATISLQAIIDGPQANAGAGTGSPGTGSSSRPAWSLMRRRTASESYLCSVIIACAVTAASVIKP